MPLGFPDLEEQLIKNESRIKCPVKKCTTFVERQHYKFQREDRFKCPIHKIFISPSTFEYESLEDSLLWKDDLPFLNSIISSEKRECRMTRERSEDALTWNVFRYMQRSNSLSSFFKAINNEDQREPSLFYWSYDPDTKKSWHVLGKARRVFGEHPKRNTEPDLIIKTENAIVMVEAKLTSNNNTKPSNVDDYKHYLDGGSNWFSKVFKSDYKNIAVAHNKYELMRLWLLGTWMANLIDSNFHLVSLLREGEDDKISDEMGALFVENSKAKYSKITWEDLYRQIKNDNVVNAEKDIILEYFKNKTIGYDNDILKKAFKI